MSEQSVSPDVGVSTPAHWCAELGEAVDAHDITLDGLTFSFFFSPPVFRSLLKCSL